MIKSRSNEEEEAGNDVFIRGITHDNWTFIKKRSKETGYLVGEYFNALIEQEMEEIEQHEKKPARKKLRKAVRKKTKTATE